MRYLEINIMEKQDFVKIGGKTAMARTKASVPTRKLISSGRIPQGASVLNHGCGRSEYDREELMKVAGEYEQHDPNHCPNPDALDKEYDVVISNFVMNVLPPEVRDDAWKDVARATGGTAYVSVRSQGDKSIMKAAKKKYKDGIITGIGTFQKPYSAVSITREAKKYFNNVELIMGTKGGISWTVACSDSKYNQQQHQDSLNTQNDEQSDDKDIEEIRRLAGIS